MSEQLSYFCTCGLKKPFKKCCGRFLDDGLFAKTPEQLMRSRYSAYALGAYGSYLLATWFPATAEGLSAADLSQKTVCWRTLEVLNKSQHGDKGEVEFKAYFSKDQYTHELDCLHERSSFIRTKGRWYYIGGVVNEPSL
jgi:SEC-C motif domain protein